jgi:L,D-peptidoglycan transpeptidase YkuD (ErfK/YbiS/YcfS/YnhG family)
MALAIEFQAMIDRGEVRRYSDLARLGCVSRERSTQVMMLNWLAPDIQEAILRLPNKSDGCFAVSETTSRQIVRLLQWKDQRHAWKLRLPNA